jgi:hypothetical protein
MSVTKRISGTYTIQSVNPSDRVYINTNTVVIDGNLLVLGNSLTVDTVNVSLGDQYITLNANLYANTAPTLNAGITVNRGTGANAWLIWNETVKSWQVTDQNTVYSNIATAATTIANVYADPNPAISANLDLRGHSVWDSVNSSGNVQISIGTVGTGGTGIRVTNSQYNNKELALKDRAFAYSILFG